MLDTESYLKKTQELILEKNEFQLFKFMEGNIEKYFSTADIFCVYQKIRPVDVSTSLSSIPKLIKAWLAFLCGDNVTLAFIMKSLDETDLVDAHEYSMFCSLKAISGFGASLNDREKYASLSVDILHKEDKTFYMANAQLTYGQMLASQDRYRKAAEAFAKAYDLFDFNNMQFPAVVARVNEMLNRTKLGEFKSVIDVCQNLLIMSAQFNIDEENVWDILNLPLGICYYELNKPHLAIKHLLIAKSNIERLKLFHMHGLIEIYLFKAYYILDDQLLMEKVYLDTKAIYEPMHDRMGNIILSMFYLLMWSERDSSDIEYNIQQLEMVYETLKENSPSLVIQMLVFLKSKGLSNLITQNEINKHLERLRFIGIISDLHLFLILNANLHQYENNNTLAISHLQEALRIHKEFGTSVAFNFASPIVLSHLKKLNEDLWRFFVKENVEDNLISVDQLLSNREKEIMLQIAKGKTNKEIGDLLFIGVGTVKWHINHIFSKLQVNNRVQAIEKAKMLGEI